ncbi:MAG: SpoIID/LytB domain-containing protein [Clostridiales bacterium]|jgi:stage II sporulation protein D|nr:SpoIID/LytB domain-containing protein [Clostridiales bacterium]
MLKKSVFTLLCLFFVIVGGRSFFAVEFDGFLRVGLEQYFLERPQINIYSRHLELGIFGDGQFHPIGTLASQSRFSAIPANMPLARLPATFATLGEAQSAATFFANSAPAWLADGTWGIFIPADYAALVGAESLPASTSRIALQADGQLVLISENANLRLQIRDSEGITNLGTRQYRGVIELARFRGQNLTAVNIIHIDEYLYSVVPSEMPALWNIEAVRAQAVAARTFTLHRLATRAAGDYQLCDTVFSQVYSGIGREHPYSTQAVRDTRGLVLIYDGQPILAVYSACAGGHTTNSEDAWGSPLPYLRARPELYPSPESMFWQRTITRSQINQLLNSANIHIGPTVSVEIITNDHGRVMQFIIHGQTGSHTLERENIRNFFNPAPGGGLRSRMFWLNTGEAAREVRGQRSEYILTANGLVPAPQTLYILDASGNMTPLTSDPLPLTSTFTTDAYYIHLSGRGWGHGVGMSQHGARAMADNGHDFRAILGFYYAGAELVNIGR